MEIEGGVMFPEPDHGDLRPGWTDPEVTWVWPPPEVDRPSMDELEQSAFDGVCEASDGCDVEPDGVCPHGHPSWLLRLGFI